MGLRPPSVPTLDELHAVVELAPNLETLTLNLFRDNNNTVNGGHPQWPWVTLELLATGLPDLTDLTIYFELASECYRQSLGSATRWRRWLTKCEGECIMVDRYAQPMLNKTTAAELTGFLQRHKTGQPLKSVSFRSGDWSPPWDGPLRDEQWLDEQKVEVTCRLEIGATRMQPDTTRFGRDEIVCNEENRLKLYTWEKNCRARALREEMKGAAMQTLLLEDEDDADGA